VIFRDPRDREHFLERLEEMTVRYRVRVHAYALMNTHYHALVQTPEANLSAALQWLHLSHAAWFNARHNRWGPLWQGRFRAVPVEAGAWAYRLSLYIHLNPVCTEWFGLGKRRKRAEALGWARPSRQEATRRRRELRRFPWSSYRAYAGYVQGPAWLQREVLLARAHAERTRRQTRYRQEVQQVLTRGTEVETLERLADGVGIGEAAFMAMLKKAAGRASRETTGKRALRRRVGLEEVLQAVATVRGEAWEHCGNRRGDWARPLAMWAARGYAGMTLREIGAALGGRDYGAVSMAIKRFEAQAAHSRTLAEARRKLAEMLIVET
jgi:REP element-mobilizing transposase RayT